MAVDVCDLCYGDLCRSCALPIKGRKDRVCKDCALTVSGVRGGGKPEIRGDRRTVKSRRKAYAEIEQPEDFFRFFDADLPADALTAGHPPPPASKEDREKAAASGSNSAGLDSAGLDSAGLHGAGLDGAGLGSAGLDSAGSNSAESNSGRSDGNSSTGGDGTGFRRLLGRLRPTEPDTVDDDLVAIDEILSGDEPSTGEDESDEEKEADAVTQLADIRRRDRAAGADAGGPEVAPGDTDDVSDLSTEVALATDLSDAVGSPPPDSSVGIPSTLLQGFRDGHAEDPADPTPWTAPDNRPDITEQGDEISRPRPDPLAAVREDEGDDSGAGTDPLLDRGPNAEPGPAPSHDHDVDRSDPGKLTAPSNDNGPEFTVDPFDSRPGDDKSYHEERRRTLRPVAEYPAGLDENGNSTSRPIGHLDQMADVSPRLRDLMADLADQTPSTGPTENPFLKRSRVVSEPDTVPDFSTDPFSTEERFGSESTARSGVTRDRVPAPISPSSSSPPDAAEPPEHPHQESPIELDSPDRKSVESAGSKTEPPAAEMESDAQPATDSEDHPEPPADSVAAPISPDTEIAESATSDASTPPNRPPAATYTPAERHPLAAFAESDRHPLAAFARPTVSTPTGPQPPPALQPPADPQLSPMDDLFRSEQASLEIDPAEGTAEVIDDVPPIDDVLPSESTGTELPPDSADTALPPEPAESGTSPSSTEVWETWEPTEPETPTGQSESWETWEPTEPETPTGQSESWDTWESAEVSEAQEPWQPTEPDQTTDAAREPWQPTEPDQTTEAAREPWQPTEPDQTTDAAWEPWQPTEPDQTTEATAGGEDSEALSPSSAVLNAGDDDTAAWTAVDDLPGLDVNTPQQRPDTDARGSWIPPALRGIAPDAKEAAEDLPRRRS